MEGLANYGKEDRPWGGFGRFTLNEPTTVKIVSVKAGEAISLQTHANRDEFWRVLEGSGTITIDGKDFQAKAGDNYFGKRGMTHRVAGEEGGLRLLEIAFGAFDEQDITRLEDRYGRI